MTATFMIDATLKAGAGMVDTTLKAVMTDTTLETCTACDAVLSPWESGCACRGPRWWSIREALYAVACTAKEPLHARDFVRNAERDYGMHLSQATAIATLAPDPRFCWAGKGLYALYRHGPLPGPRNLEEATRIVLVAAGAPMYRDAVDFCLKTLGYRYNVASLRNAVGRSFYIGGGYGVWDHSRGEAAELNLRNEIPIVPPYQRAEWRALRDCLRADISLAVAERQERLRAVGNPYLFGLNWEG